MPDEMVSQFGRCTATLGHAFESQDRELFEQAMQATLAIFAKALERIDELEAR